MKKYFKTVANFFTIRNKKPKIVNNLLALLFVIYFTIICFPNFLFDYSFKYKNFKIHSTEPIDNAIKTVLDKAEVQLLTSEIDNNSRVQNIYLCNSFSLYTFLAPLSRKAFACNYLFNSKIFIASSNIKNNKVFKNDDKDNYTRTLSNLISHETTHTLIKEKIGSYKTRTLSDWKNEGYCEYVSYGKTNNLKKTQRFLFANKGSNKPGTLYKKYYIAMNYLMNNKKMTFDDILNSKLSFEDVLSEVELLK